MNVSNNNSINNFDNRFNQYSDNKSETKCPNCGRELLGLPNECPYCMMKLR